jgi:PAS domain S-box-containing protein
MDEARYRHTLDSLLEGFQILSFEWIYLYVNPSAGQHARKDPDELIGRRIMDVYPAIDETPGFKVMERVMIARKGESLENHFTYPDGRTRWFELRIEPVPEGICVFSLDIDDRKHAELALRRVNERLETQVGERTRELEAINRDLESFTSTVSHDLRAPLWHVIEFSRVIREDDGDRLSESGTDALAHIVAAAERMQALIAHLLEFCRLGLARVAAQPLHLTGIIESARAEVEPQAAAHAGGPAEWHIAPMPLVHGDPSLVRLVFVNLLSNALKYSRTRTPPRIEIGARDDETPGFTVVWVRDNGVGFDPRYTPKLFGVFQRLHPEHQFEGTGVGLANVRRIVERHGGRTWAEGAVDGGATFYFTLPTKNPLVDGLV